VVASEERPGHGRPGERRGIPPDGTAGGIELPFLCADILRRCRAEVELVRVARRDSKSPRRSAPAREDSRPDPAVLAGTAVDLHRASPERAIPDADLVTVERPAGRLAPQAVEQLQLIFEQVGPLPDLREGQAERFVV